MPKYKILVCRIRYGFKGFIVEAEDETEACDFILNHAGDHDYMETSADYEIDYAEEVDETIRADYKAWR